MRRSWVMLAALACVASPAHLQSAPLRSGDTQVFLRVSPLPGESKTHSSGAGTIRPLGSSSAGASRTVQRNMKWNCEVSCRGKRLPEKAEVRVFYIGYDGKGMTPKLLKSETRPIALGEAGRGSVELVSPTVRLSKSTSTTGGGTHGGIRGTTTKVRGERIGGCVVQLWLDGRLAKSWSSNSTWARAANDPAFSVEALARRDPHGLN